MSELSVQQIVESIQKELGLVKNTGIFYANQAAEHKILDEQRRKTDVWSAALRISAQILTTMKATVSNSMFLKPEETMTPDWNQRLQKHDYRQVLAEVARLTGLSIVSASRQSSDIVKIDTTRVGITDAGLNLGDAPFEKLFAQSAENKRLWDENLQTIADEFLQQVIQGFNQLEHKCFGLSLHVLIMLGGEDPPTGFFQLGGRQFHYSGLRKEQIDQITSLVNSKIAGGRVTIIKDATREGKLAVCLDSITNYVADPVFDYRAIRHLYNNTVSPELQVIVDEVIANTQPYSKDAQLLDTKTPRALVYPLKITKGNPHETFADKLYARLRSCDDFKNAIMNGLTAKFPGITITRFWRSDDAKPLGFPYIGFRYGFDEESCGSSAFFAQQTALERRVSDIKSSQLDLIAAQVLKFIVLNTANLIRNGLFDLFVGDINECDDISGTATIRLSPGTLMIQLGEPFAKITLDLALVQDMEYLDEVAKRAMELSEGLFSAKFTNDIAYDIGYTAPLHVSYGLRTGNLLAAD